MVHGFRTTLILCVELLALSLLAVPGWAARHRLEDPSAKLDTNGPRTRSFVMGSSEAELAVDSFLQTHDGKNATKEKLMRPAGCKKSAARSLCGEKRPAWIINYVEGFSIADLQCITYLCQGGSPSGQMKCCRTMDVLRKKLQGKSAEKLALDKDTFNTLLVGSGLSLIEKGEVAAAAMSPVLHRSSAVVAVQQSLAEGVVGSQSVQCKKLLQITLCKDYGEFIIEALAGLKPADLACIPDLCNQYPDGKCCGTLGALRSTMHGEDPGTLRIAPDKFEKLSRIAGLAESPVVSESDTEPVISRPPQKVAEPKPSLGDAIPGWVERGGMWYAAPSSSKTDSVQPPGCKSLSARYLCAENRKEWILEKTAGLGLDALQCIGWLCKGGRSGGKTKCCQTMDALRQKLEGQNAAKLALEEDKFKRLLIGSGQSFLEQGLFDAVTIRSVVDHSPVAVAAQPSLAEVAVDSQSKQCKKLLQITLCKDYGAFIIEALAGLKPADLECIPDLCNQYPDGKCCGTLEALRSTMDGEDPGTLRIASDKFEKLSRIAGLAETPLVSDSDTQPVISRPPKKVAEPKSSLGEAIPGWIERGGMWYAAPSSSKAYSVQSPGCKSLSARYLCVENRKEWILEKTAGLGLDALQCIGWLCQGGGSEGKAECCQTMNALREKLEGQNAAKLALEEDKFKRLLIGSAQ